MQTAIHPTDTASPACNRHRWREINREMLAADFAAVRGATESLADGIGPEDQNLQSMAEASPVKWHRAHTTWFFETFILKTLDSGWEDVDPQYNYLFNSYYNGIGEQYPRPQRGLISRPDVTAIADYRRRVDGAIIRLIDKCQEKNWERLRYLLVLGLNHEQQHQELMVTDLKHGFSRNPLGPAWVQPPQPAGPSAGPMRWQTYSGGIIEIGAIGEYFCFDNETPRHRVLIEDFELASRPVTCGEFAEFIDDGGYREPRLWLADGWDWVQRGGIEAPLYWERRDGQWWHYTAGGLRPVDADEILCHVSFYEAQAFAQWAGARLPDEAEWESVAASRPPSGHFADHGRLHPVRPGDSGGPSAVFGDVWEWTGSSYAPYPGFEPAAGAIGEYNGKFMANQMVLRGGSCATPAGHIRATYRNFFYPGDRWQFSGIRLARTA